MVTYNLHYSSHLKQGLRDNELCISAQYQYKPTKERVHHERNGEKAKQINENMYHMCGNSTSIVVSCWQYVSVIIF